MDAKVPYQSGSSLNEFLGLLVARWYLLFATIILALAVAGVYVLLRSVEYTYVSSIQMGHLVDPDKYDLHPIYDADVAKALLGEVLEPAARARIGKAEGLRNDVVPGVKVLLTGGQSASNYIVELTTVSQEKDADLVKRIHTAIGSAFSAMSSRALELARIRFNQKLAQAEEKVTTLKQQLAQLPARRPVVEQDLTRIDDLINKWEQTQSSALTAGAANNVGSLDTLVTGYVSLTQLEARRSALERELKLDLPAQQEKLNAALADAQADVDALKNMLKIGFAAPTLLSTAVRSVEPASRGAASILSAALVIGLLLGLSLILIWDRLIDLYRAKAARPKSASAEKREFAARSDSAA